MGAKVASSGGGGKRGRLEVTAEPNVIPFIDVMLVLLIIFMVAAPIATVDIEVGLPASKVLPSERPPKPTWVSLKDNGGGDIRVYVMNDEVTYDTLGEKTQEAVSANDPRKRGDINEIRNERVYVRADGTTQYKNVVRVMNKLQDVGFYKIGLVAEDKRR